MLVYSGFSESNSWVQMSLATVLATGAVVLVGWGDTAVGSDCVGAVIGGACVGTVVACVAVAQAETIIEARINTVNKRCLRFISFSSLMSF